MGAQASREADGGGSGDGPGPPLRLTPRTWQEGRPFTLLHDEAFVADRYHELRGGAASGEQSLKTGPSSTNEEDDLQQVADLARVQLFSQPVRETSSANTSTTESSNAASATSAAPERSAASNALAAMVASLLARESPVTKANELQRVKLVAIVEDYYAQLADQLHKDAAARRRSVLPMSPDIASNGSPQHNVITGGSSASVFSVGSFRVQLEMLREFRTTMPTLFENGVLALVRSLLDFPPFALQDIATHSPEEALVTDVHLFCRKLLQDDTSALTKSHREVLLLLLLAFGVSTGRISLLLDFVDGIVHGKFDTVSCFQGDSFNVWIERFVKRMESYNIDFSLSRFDEETLVKKFLLKTITTEADSDFNEKTPQDRASIATDGTFLYIWSADSGLQKVGTGVNFTVPGRIYVEQSAEIYARALIQPQSYRYALFGMGIDVLEIIQSEAIRFAADANGTRKVRNVIQSDETHGMQWMGASNQKLFVSFIENGIDSMRIFDADDDLQLHDSVVVTSAFYGRFEMANEEGLSSLSNLAAHALTSEQSALLFNQDLLQTLLPSTRNIHITENSQLVVFYAQAGKTDLIHKTFQFGDNMLQTNTRKLHYNSSSLVYCGDSLYLSSSAHSDEITKSRSSTRISLCAIRIDPQNLDVFEIVDVPDEPSDNSAPSSSHGYPLYTITSEGKYLYSIRMTEDMVHVNIFEPKVTLSDTRKLHYVRSIDLSKQDVHSPIFVNCFLNIAEWGHLESTDLNFRIPSIYTNGSVIAMVLPNGSNDTVTYHGVFFDCEDGKFLGGECHKVGNIQRGNNASASDRSNYFEQTIMGSAYCFDAKNNLVWAYDNVKGSLASYQNPGRKISLIDTSINKLLREINTTALPDDAIISTSTTPMYFLEAIAVRVLCFLLKIAESSDVDELKMSSSAIVVPFVSDLQVVSFQVLLKLISEYSASFDSNEPCRGQLPCLRACLGILHTNIQIILRSSGTCAKVMDLMQKDLSAPLNALIHFPDAVLGESQPPAEITEWKTQVKSLALDLYTTSMPIFYSGVNEQINCALPYLERWASNQIDSTELAILARLLSHLCLEASSIQEAVIDSDVTFDLYHHIISHAVVLQKKRFHNLSPGLPSSDDDPFTQLICLINCIAQSIMVSVRSSTGAVLQKSLVRAFSTSCIILDGIVDICKYVLRNAKDNSDRKTWTIVEHLMRDGFVGTLCPMVTSSGLAFVRCRNDLLLSRLMSNDQSDQQNDIIFKTIFDYFKENTTKLSSLLECMDQMGQLVDPGDRLTEIENISVVNRTEIIESTHEYENNMDSLVELRIPGASRIVVVFDSRSRTEFNYDYVTFFKNENRVERYGEPYYSGRDAEHNWPGVGSNPPLIIESDHCFVHFHSDSSNTDWGFKFCATGEILQKKTYSQLHWLLFMSESVAQLMDEHIKVLMDGYFFAPVEEIEAQNSKYLQSDLLKNGICSKEEQNASVVCLLQDFANPPENSQAAHVINALLNRSGAFRQRAVSRSSSFTATAESSANKQINHAVRAVAAAIFHHNMWGMDAYAFAQNLRGDISDHLLRGWNNAQKMRDWFHLGDAADASIHRAISPSRRRSRKLHRQPSAFKGVSDESLQILCSNVIERAKFLLELTPASFTYVSGAKRRWGLLAKYGHAIGKMSSDESPLDKWYNLLDELQAATELRSLFQYRRKSSERMRNTENKSVTEQVLAFIQSDCDVKELRRVIMARSLRAESRAVGMRVFAASWQRSSNQELKSVLAETFLSAMKGLSTCTPHDTDELGKPGALALSRIHFDINVSGCEDELRKQLNQSFGNCLTILAKELSSVVPNDTFSTALISGILKVFAIDFELDDSYLLHESRIVTQIIRLLSCEDVGVRRSAQCVLSILLSRFVIDQVDTLAEGNDIDDASNSTDICAFQRQLLAVVGLQLEGVTSFVKSPMQINTDFNIEDQIQAQSRMYYLPENSPGWNAPHDRKNAVGWNHSIMLWLYVSSSSCTYTLKIGNEVRRGPDWKDDNNEPIGETDIGIVTSIHDLSKVQIRWLLSNSVSECTFDPKHNIYDVIPVEQGVGGLIFVKGNTSLVKDTIFASPWSHMALFLSDKRELSYRIASGSENDCVYNTSYELEVDEWSHIAIVQEEEVLKFFLNGTMINQHLLNPFLLVQGDLDPSESKVIESTHPYADSTDQYWPVHIPGATKIRITFDPLSDIDSTMGYVRVYKDASCAEHWGDDKYTGKYHDPERNFPGAQSHRGRRRKYVEPENTVGNESIEVLSDRFVVNFHSEGTSSGWGFRLLALPEFPKERYMGHDDLPHKGPSLNPYPWYFGQAPGRVWDDQAAKCWIYEPKILNFSISESDIVAEIQSTSPGSEYVPVRVSNDRLLHILGLVRTCSETSFGRQMISTPENLRNLLFLAVDDRVSVEVHCGSINVLKYLASSVAPDILNKQFSQVVPSSKMHFTEAVFSRLADLLNIWQKYEKIGDTCKLEVEIVGCDQALDDEPLELRSSSQGVTSLIYAYVSLLRKLSLISDWSESIFELISTSLKCCSKTTSLNDLGSVMAALALCGGSYDGIFVGGRVKCCVNIDGKEAIETGYLTQYVLKHGVRLARVVFDCDTTRPVDVPINDIALENDGEEADLAQFMQSLTPYMNQLMDLFKNVLRVTIDANHGEANGKPKLVKKEHVEILESEHPYTTDMDVTYPLEFHGATEIVIYFDSASCTADSNDFVQFKKRQEDASDSSDEYWGVEKYFGGSFPGIGDNQPLRIPSSSVDVHFHTGSSTTDPNNNWGFRLRAYAFDEILTYPPEIPPSPLVNALNDINARCVKAIDRVLLSKSLHGVGSLFTPLLPVLSEIAIRQDDGQPTQCAPKSQVFESKHPYANSVHEYMTVTFSGASTLRVTFDPQSRTEVGCDYLCFFKDKTLTDRWGLYQFSGVEDTANWPGTGGRPPLVIPADSFTMLWCTDATNVEWGWKFTVNAEFPSVVPLSLPLGQLDKRAHQLSEILYERPKHQRQPMPSEFVSFDKLESASASLGSLLPSDPMWQILRSRYLSSDGQLQNLPRKDTFRVVNDTGGKIFSDITDDASIICTLEHGEEFLASTHQSGWVKIEKEELDNITQQGGWILHRNDDEFFVRSTSSLEQNEDLLVLGIDDSPLDFFQSTLEMDDCNPEQDSMVKFTCPFTFEDLKGQQNRLQSLAYDSHRALATKLAQHAVRTFLSGEHNHDQLRLEMFGSPDDFLFLVSKFFAQERTHKEYDKCSNTWILLGKTLRQMFDEEVNDVSMHQLLFRCHEIVRNSSGLLPKGRGAVRIVESAHPYLDNLDQYWQVSIPGAKKIRIIFDPRSKSESGCDYVCFYKLKSDRSELYGEAQYGGRSGSENWPGFGDREPLIIESDSFEMHFHSDSSQNDWGFKMFAIGIFNEDDKNKEQHVHTDELMKLLSLCCWVFDELSGIPQLGRRPLSSTLLNSEYMLETLIIGLERSPQRISLHLLEIMIKSFRDRNFVSKLSLVMVKNARSLIKAKLRAQHHTEECIETKSHYMQVLTECSLAIDLAIDSYCYSELTTPSQWSNAFADQSSPLVFQSGHPCFWWKSDGYNSHASVQHRFCLQNFSDELIIGIAEAHGAVSQEPAFIFSWNSAGFIQILLDPEGDDHGNVISRSQNYLAKGDEVTFLLDFELKSFVVLKNGLVAVAVAGSEHVDALVSWETLFPPQITPNVVIAVKTGDPSARILHQTLLYSSLSLLESPPEPAWYEKITDATSMLLDYHENRSSNVIAIESEHPFGNLSTLSELSHVHIAGAIALEIKFDKRTKMRENDQIKFVRGGDLDLGNPETVILKGLSGERDTLTVPMLFLADSQKRAVLPRIGDFVTRSKDWEYGDEDGGPGSIGAIREIVAWQGKTGSAVRVQWLSNDAVCTYRFGYNGYFDVQQRIQENQQLTPLIIEGESLSFSVQVAEPKKLDLALSEDTDSFVGSLKITGSENLMLSINDMSCLKDDYTVEFWICVGSHWLHNSASSVLEMEIFHIKSSDAFPFVSVCVSQSQEPLVYLTNITEDGALTRQKVYQDAIAQIDALLIVDEWIHMAFIFAGNQIELYQNGATIFTGILSSPKLTAKSIVFGSQARREPTQIDICDDCLLPCVHIYDVKLWDVALQIEQIQSHTKGIDSIAHGDSRPGTPRSKSALSTSVLFPPSPPRSPRSLARSFVVPPQFKQWVTSNRTGRDTVTVRSSYAVHVSRSKVPPEQVIYYEAHVLTSGKISIGWIPLQSSVDDQESMLGEAGNAFGVEPNRKKAHFCGNDSDFDFFSEQIGLNSPRSPRKSIVGEVFGQFGDVVGCAICTKTSEMSFYVNGQLIACTEDGNVGSHNLHSHVLESLELENEQKKFDSLVGEMLSMGFSRQSSTEAIEASGAQEIPAAVEWLLERNPTDAVANPSSPRRRLSSVSSSGSFGLGSPRNRRQKALLCDEPINDCFVPAASLESQGAQSIAWNFGHLKFKYAPKDMNLVSVMEAAHQSEHHFQVFNHTQKQWDRAQYRHKIQDITPSVVGWWRLDEGNGTTLEDSSGNEHTGYLVAQQNSILSDTGFETMWDAEWTPPLAATRRNRQPIFFNSDESTVNPRRRKAIETTWGYKFYVIPHFSVASIGRRRFLPNAARLAECSRGLISRHDHQLVKYVNKAAQSKQLAVSQLLRASWPELAPSTETLVRWPVLVEIVTGQSKDASSEYADELNGEITSRSLAIESTGAMKPSSDRLANHFKILQELNGCVHRLLPFIKFRRPRGGFSGQSSAMSLYELVAEQRGRIFSAVKLATWEDALRRTNETGVSIEVTLNRPKAMRHRATGKPDTTGRYTLFSQAFRQLCGLDGTHFRRQERIYTVTFLGENAQDAGGPYRETFAQYCEELHSTRLPLFLLTSNAQHNVGVGREKWILNPGATSPTLLQMYEFLGKFMGSAIRSKQYLALNLAPLVWKKLVGEHITTEDLAAVDSMVINSMQKMRTIDQCGVTEEMFEDIVMETFSTLSADNRVVQLVPNGANLPVTFANRCEYADLVEQYRLHEYDREIEALVQGIAKVIPAKLLACFTGAELEFMVCGTPEIDIDLLEKCTEYSGCSADQTHIVWFWKVLRSFSHEERSTFLRFVWGRSRLPASEKEFPQLFKLQSFSKQQPGRSVDGYLPIAHTCFFAVEMPPYSSEQVLREKLLYAIYNCQEIDADGDSVAANQLGWEE